MVLHDKQVSREQAYMFIKKTFFGTSHCKQDSPIWRARCEGSAFTSTIITAWWNNQWPPLRDWSSAFMNLLSSTCMHWNISVYGMDSPTNSIGKWVQLEFFLWASGRMRLAFLVKFQDGCSWWVLRNLNHSVFTTFQKLRPMTNKDIPERVMWVWRNVSCIRQITRQQQKQ